MKYRLFSLSFSFGIANMDGTVSFYYGALILGSFYASICFREQVMDCLTSAKPLSAKRHQNLFFGQLVILFVLIYGMVTACRTLDVVAVEQILGGLITSALGIVLDIVAHLVFLLRRGNSKGSYRVLFFADAAVQLLEISVSMLFLGYLILDCQLPIFHVRLLYEQVIGVYRHYDNWRRRMRLRLMIECLPIALESDIRREDICIICRLDMCVGEGRKLPCGHCFHSECIERWVGRQLRCPICKHDLKEALESVERKGNTEMQHGRVQTEIKRPSVSRTS
jgi:E3 ubiquitin-protein ligase synoviolin